MRSRPATWTRMEMAIQSISHIQRKGRISNGLSRCRFIKNQQAVTPKASTSVPGRGRNARCDGPLPRGLVSLALLSRRAMPSLRVWDAVPVRFGIGTGAR